MCRSNKLLAYSFMAILCFLYISNSYATTALKRGVDDKGNVHITCDITKKQLSATGAAMGYNFYISKLNSDEFTKPGVKEEGVYKTKDNKFYQVFDYKIHELTEKTANTTPQYVRDGKIYEIEMPNIFNGYFNPVDSANPDDFKKAVWFRLSGDGSVVTNFGNANPGKFYDTQHGLLELIQFDANGVLDSFYADYQEDKPVGYFKMAFTYGGDAVAGSNLTWNVTGTFNEKSPSSLRNLTLKNVVLVCKKVRADLDSGG